MQFNDQQNSSTSGDVAWHVEKQALHRSYSKQVRKLMSGREAGKRRHVLQREFFRHPKVKQAAILKATKGKIGREQTYALAQLVDPYAEQQHVVATYPLTKTNGGKRNICILSPVLSATHKIIKCALDAEFVRHPSLFGIKHHGRDQAAVHIQHLQREGYRDLGKPTLKTALTAST